MANQNQRRSVSDEFADQYTNTHLRGPQESANDNRGISNVRVVRTAVEEEERKQIVRYENNQRQIMAAEAAMANNPTRGGRVKGSRLKATITNNLARVRATPVVIEIAVWYWPWYIFEMILAVLGSISFGIAGWLFTIADPATVDALTESWSGVGVTAFFVVFLGISGFIFFFRVCQILISTLQFKLLLIHPWFGEGAGFKITTLMLTLIGSFIPLLQIFPVFWLWIIAVLWNPK